MSRTNDVEQARGGAGAHAGRDTPAASRWVVAAFVGGTVAIGGLVGALNVPGEWYRALEKPWFNPPDWLFGPVWTVLYAMVGYAGFRAWSYGRADPAGGTGEAGDARNAIFRVWVVQLALNLLWTPIFFTAQSLPLATIEIGALLVAILAFMALAWKRDRVSFWLFVPYLAWVSFASVLTATIWAMNA